jgi:thymidylate kinase
MPIICFEGASAAGKTALSVFLRDDYSAAVIPEVNLLFERKDNESKFWYFEKQIERWQLAVSAAKNHKIVILDGDPFQPFWYNWSYNFDFGEPFKEIIEFYEKKLAASEIDFPDKYFILSVNPDELRKRKANDAARTRKNFERHLRFIEPQFAYFNFIKSLDSRLVEFIENEEIDSSSQAVMDSIKNHFIYRTPRASLMLFLEIKNWLQINNPENFKAQTF